MPERTKGLCPSEQKVFVRANKGSLSERTKGLCPGGQKVFVRESIRRGKSRQQPFAVRSLMNRTKGTFDGLSSFRQANRRLGKYRDALQKSRKGRHVGRTRQETIEKCVLDIMFKHPMRRDAMHRVSTMQRQRISTPSGTAYRSSSTNMSFLMELSICRQSVIFYQYAAPNGATNMMSLTGSSNRRGFSRTMKSRQGCNIGRDIIIGKQKNPVRDVIFGRKR
jgi:hypothetical protein